MADDARRVIRGCEMDVHVDRARRWIAALGVERQGRCHLVDRDARGLLVCWQGAGMRCAEADGYVRMVELGYGPQFVARQWGGHPMGVYGALSHWCGLPDVWDLRAHLEDMPLHLADAVRAHVETERRSRPLAAELEDFLRCRSDGHPVWLLNDFRVPFPVLADVMRFALDVDRHLIATGDEVAA